MRYVERDAAGDVVAAYARLQPGRAEELLPDDHSDLVVFRKRIAERPHSRLLPAELILYRNGGTPITGASSGGWVWPGNALSASTSQLLYTNSRLVRFKSAFWTVAWNPRAQASNTGVRLVHADGGPKNITPIATILLNGTVTPVVDGADVTDALNALIEAGVPKHLGHQIVGDPAGRTPLIYSSVIRYEREI